MARERPVAAFLIEDREFQVTQAVDAKSAADQLEVGRIQGRQFGALPPRGGRVLYVHGPPDTSVAKERLEGMEHTLAGKKIDVRVLNGDWTEAGGCDPGETR